MGEKYIFNSDLTFSYSKDGVTESGTYTLAENVYTLVFDNGFTDVFNSAGYTPTDGLGGEDFEKPKQKLYIQIAIRSARNQRETFLGTFSETEFRDMLPNLYSIQAADLNGESSGSITSVMLGGIDRTAPVAASIAMDY